MIEITMFAIGFMLGLAYASHIRAIAKRKDRLRESASREFLRK